jgi:hypothetical protein
MKVWKKEKCDCRYSPPSEAEKGLQPDLSWAQTEGGSAVLPLIDLDASITLAQLSAAL